MGEVLGTFEEWWSGECEASCSGMRGEVQWLSRDSVQKKHGKGWHGIQFEEKLVWGNLCIYHKGELKIFVDEYLVEREIKETMERE